MEKKLCEQIIKEGCKILEVSGHDYVFTCEPVYSKYDLCRRLHAIYLKYKH